MAPIERHPLGKNHGIILRICVALHPRATLHPHSKVIYFPVGEFWAPASFPWEFTAFEVGSRVGVLLGSCGWILGSGFVSLKIYNIWGGLRCGLLLGSCGFWRCFCENLQHLRWAPVWASRGSGDVSMRIYSIWGGLRCGRLWVPATFLREFTAFCVGTGHVKDLPGKKNAGEKVPSQISR